VRLTPSCQIVLSSRLNDPKHKTLPQAQGFAGFILHRHYPKHKALPALFKHKALPALSYMTPNTRLKDLPRLNQP
jgi:hypothetical protein